MQSEFKPKHLQRAKETLQRQLQVVQEERAASKDDTKVSLSLWQRFLRFWHRIF
jgi:hypothetical protein